MILQVLLISTIALLLVNHSYEACTASSTASTGTGGAGTDDYDGALCCIITASSAGGTAGSTVFNAAVAASCPTTGLTTTGNTVVPTSCKAGYYRDATNGCKVCSTGYSTIEATTSAACTSCGTGIDACTISAGGTITPTDCSDLYGLQTDSSSVVTCVAFSTISTSPAGCLTGTISAANTVTCSGCGADGYSTAAVATNACTACATTGCGACGATASGTCTACQTGYYNTGTTATISTCSACATGCATCPSGTDGATKCTTVALGYKLSAAAPATPTKCGGDGFTNNVAGATTCSVACIANCNTCNVDVTKCEVCKDNFELQADGTCLAIAAADIHVSCATTNKKASAANCLSCKADQNRELPLDATSTATPQPRVTVGTCGCKEGFGDKSTASTPDWVCAQCPENALKCTFTATGVAVQSCKTGFFQAGAQCLAKDASNVVGYFFDATTSKFLACDGTCKSCTATGKDKCTACKDAPSTWVEPTEAATNFKTYIKGVRVQINNTCYDDCPAGWVANEARSACEEDAGNSFLLSIFMIFTIFLMM